MAKKKKLPSEQAVDALAQLAAGSAADAVSLLFLSDDEIGKKLKRLNLINISEIKKVKGGGMEIKFFDRLKACEMLENLSPDGSRSAGLYAALERGAQNLCCGEDDD